MLIMKHKKMTLPISIIKKSAEQFWRRCFIDSSYDYKTLTNQNWVDFIKRLKKHKIKKVLDLGCGFGHMLSPAGIAYFSFDGPSEDEEDKKGFVLLDDGTRYYIKGKFKNMLWRYYIDQELKDLIKNFGILEFKVGKNGRRSIWVKKF